jgi:hypothetical protein
MNILFRAYFGGEKIKKKLIYSGQDPDPDVFKSWIRSRTKIIQIRITGFLLTYGKHC